jgi:hypothetical protein
MLLAGLEQTKIPDRSESSLHHTRAHGQHERRIQTLYCVFHEEHINRRVNLLP